MGGRMSEPSARRKRTHSSVSKLPPEVQAAITARLNAGATYQDIVDYLHAMGHAVSRSAVGRWGQSVHQRHVHFAAAADLAHYLTEKLSAEQLEEAATVLALDLVVDALMQHDDITTGDEGLYLPHVTQLISALARVSVANLARDKWNADVERKAQEAADAVSRQARSEGLSDETVELIKSRILGINEAVG
jgi:hypothetical protein